MKDSSGCIVPIVSLAATALLTLLITAARIRARDDGIDLMRKEAIEHGVGEWAIDPKTGEKAFTWKGAGK